MFGFKGNTKRNRGHFQGVIFVWLPLKTVPKLLDMVLTQRLKSKQASSSLIDGAVLEYEAQTTNHRKHSHARC